MGRPDDETEVVMRTSTQDPLAHPRTRWSLRQEGRVTFSQIICLAVLFMVGIQGLKVVASWYDNLRLKETMREVVTQAQVSTDDAVISTILAKAKQLQVPLDPRDIHLERSWHGGTRLWAEYRVTLTFPLGFSHTQRFRPEVRSSR